MKRGAQPDFIDLQEESDASAERERRLQGRGAWFVYLFALADCSAFKVGFSCNPLQRISTFSRRYFERFDLSQSRLLPVDDCDHARAIEAAIKADLSEFRTLCPAWIPDEAGGQTEWFSAVHFGQAEDRLQSFLTGRGVTAINAADFIRGELGRMSHAFELWAWSQAQQAREAWSSASRGYKVRDESRSLRDWLDAYRYFDVPLYLDDPQVLEFVIESARLRIER
jgi:hypothetical protein